MLGHFRKRKKMDNFEYQSLRNVVEEDGEDILTRYLGEVDDGGEDGEAWSHHGGLGGGL